MHGTSDDVIVSPRRTANASSPSMCFLAQYMASPSPFCSFCLTKYMSARSEMASTSSRYSFLLFFLRKYSSSNDLSKWSSIDLLPLPVIMSMSSMPEATASSTTYWIVGLSNTGNISLGCALVAGRKRVPRPAAGITAFMKKPPYLIKKRKKVFLTTCCKCT